MYAQGEGTVTDLDKAESLLLDAANKNWKIAQYEIGLLYTTKTQYAEKYKEGVDWYKNPPNKVLLILCWR